MMNAARSETSNPALASSGDHHNTRSQDDHSFTCPRTYSRPPPAASGAMSRLGTYNDPSGSDRSGTLSRGWIA